MARYRKQLAALIRSLFPKFGEEILVAEVGVMKGETSSFLLHVLPTIRMTLVDWWQPPPPDSDYARSRDRAAKLSIREHRANYQETLSRVAPFRDRVEIVVARSVDAAARYRDGHFHLVFIDADHTKQAVLDDIAAWYPKVCAGGILSGHDYGVHQVKPAVDEWIEQTGLQLNLGRGRVWWVEVPDGDSDKLGGATGAEPQLS